MQDLNHILEDFEFLDDWEDRYRYVIELGKNLPAFSPELQTDENKVHGCASQVWLASEHSDEPDPIVTFKGDSDAHIVRGLVAIVLAIYSGKRASQIKELDAMDVFQKIGLADHLSAQRANGLRSMIVRMREQAAIFMAR